MPTPSALPLARLSLVLGAAALAACTHGDRQVKTPRVGTVVFEVPGQTLRVEAEVVRTPEDRARGLMFRKELPARRGMLFLFDDEEVQSFWMKNTYLPLDMIFIAARMEVVGVVENAEPLTTSPRRVEGRSRFVLEMNAGFARANRIEAGVHVRFEGTE
jgi:uncharacterized protein